MKGTVTRMIMNAGDRQEAMVGATARKVAITALRVDMAASAEDMKVMDA
jgi:hypothetical protein